MHVYDSVIVFEKDNVQPPRDISSGQATDIEFSHLRPKSLTKKTRGK